MINDNPLAGKLMSVRLSLLAVGEHMGIKAGVPSDHPYQSRIEYLERQAATAVTIILRRLQRRLFDGATRESVGDMIRLLRSPDLNEHVRVQLYEALLPTVTAGVAVGREQLQTALPSVKAGIMPIDLEIDWTLINQQARRWLERYTFELTYANVYSITDATAVSLKQMIDEFIASPDMSIPQLSRKAEGLFDIARGEMIAVTEVTRAFAAGNLTAWRESKLVESKRWNTANDALVCPICGPLNGRVAEIGASFGGWLDHPPAHPRCRCWVTPVVTIPDNSAFPDERDFNDPYENIRPPLGRAPRGMGQEYRDRQAIINMINTHKRYEQSVPKRLQNYRGQRYLAREREVMLVRKAELGKAISAALQYADAVGTTGGDWAVARTIVKEIFDYVSFMTARGGGGYG